MRRLLAAVLRLTDCFLYPTKRFKRRRAGVSVFADSRSRFLADKFRGVKFFKLLQGGICAESMKIKTSDYGDC